MRRVLKAVQSVLWNRNHILREFVSLNWRLRYEDPRDWLAFKMAVEREMAARRPLPPLIQRVAIEYFLPSVQTTPVRVLPIGMNGYNVSWLELVYLAAFAANIKPSRVVEFGTFDGRTTVQFAINLASAGKVTTIDCAAGPVDFGDATGFCTPTSIGLHFIGRDIGRDVEVVTVDSQTADWTALYATADLVFVDADHSRDAVLRDSLAAAAMVKPGGYILWHDFLYLEGVTAALAELAGRMRIQHIEGTTLAVHQAVASTGRW